jgi:transcriptional regulator with XRE-family HTH domain
MSRRTTIWSFALAVRILPHTFRTYRILRTLTQQDLAEKSGVSIATIKRIESAKHPYRANNPQPQRLANALDVPVEALTQHYSYDGSVIDVDPFVRLRKLSTMPKGPEWFTEIQTIISYIADNLIEIRDVHQVEFVLPDPDPLRD